MNIRIQKVGTYLAVTNVCTYRRQALSKALDYISISRMNRNEAVKHTLKSCEIVFHFSSGSPRMKSTLITSAVLDTGMSHEIGLCKKDGLRKALSLSGIVVKRVSLLQK